jgi:hypothetical protein
MTDQHRATPEQWASVQQCSDHGQTGPFATAACLLELRARVEALEKAQRPFAVIDTSQWSEEQRQQAMQDLGQPGELRPLTAEEVAPVVVPAATPAASLVERVASVLHDFDDNVPYHEYARAAIREVADWLDERDTSIQGDPDCLEAPFADDAIRWLREEANR